MKYDPYIHKELQDLLAVEEHSLRPDPHSGRLLATLCDMMTTMAEQGAEIRGLRERVNALEPKRVEPVRYGLQEYDPVEMSVAGGGS